MSLLITRPRFDLETHYLFYWSELIIKAAERKSLKIFDLKKNKSTKKKVVSYLNKQSPDIVFLNGHGTDSAIFGQDNEELISVDSDTSSLRDKNVYIRACNAAKTLGISIIKEGARGFIGYRNPFWLITNKEKFSRPLEDEFARPFLECSNQVGISLVKGNSIEEAQENSMKKYNITISSMLTSKSPTTFLVPYLKYNQINQVCYKPTDFE